MLSLWDKNLKILYLPIQKNLVCHVFVSAKKTVIYWNKSFYYALKKYLNYWDHEPLSESEERRLLEKCFAGPFQNFIFYYRYIICIVFIILGGFGVWSMTQLEPPSESENYARSHTSLGRIYDLLEKYYVNPDHGKLSEGFTLVS